MVSEDAAHASLGASTAARWMACEGSVNLIDTLPDRDPDASGQNIAARQGKCAHYVAELALAPDGWPAAHYIGLTFHDVTVDEDMATHVQLYIDHVRKVMTIPGVSYWIEKKFSLALLNPPSERPMFGTSDFSAYDPASRTLYVFDLKYGQVPVEIEGNPQVKYYALGVWLTLDGKTQPVDTVVLTIIQPRHDHPAGVVRSVTITLDELVKFGNDLIVAAYATLPKDAQLHAGSHCKWCPAKARCPELYKKTQEIAATEFDTPDFNLPVPAALTPEQFANTLKLLHILDDWSASLKEHAYQELLAGRQVPGFKLVERRAERRWTGDEKEIADEVFKAGPKINHLDQVYEKPTLKSPARIEKLLGKKVFTDKLAQHVVKKSSGVKLVPEDHPSPPVLMGGAEFDMLPAPDSDNEGQDTENNEK